MSDKDEVEPWTFRYRKAAQMGDAAIIIPGRHARLKLLVPAVDQLNTVVDNVRTFVSIDTHALEALSIPPLHPV